MRYRKKFTESTIRKYWSKTDIWHNKFDSEEEFLELGHCFACGFNHFDYLEKAHIKALSIGGIDDIKNINMLCRECHHASEFLEGENYWKWFYSRTVWDVFYTYAAKQNRISEILKYIKQE